MISGSEKPLENGVSFVFTLFGLVHSSLKLRGVSVAREFVLSE